VTTVLTVTEARGAGLAAATPAVKQQSTAALKPATSFFALITPSLLATRTEPIARVR
jgi:hypothetical protein